MAENDKQYVTPEGRLINHALFERDAYKDPSGKGREGDPMYRIEMAFDEKDIEELEDLIVQAAIDEWGSKAGDDYDNGVIETPILDGDELAKKREDKGKKGDAYKGKLVIRAHTIYNRNGEDAPGGVYVCNANAEEITPADRGEVYNGCYGVASVTVQPYLIDRKKGATLYLNGFQKTDDGERLRSADPSSLFKPMMSKDSEDKGRRRRRG